MTSKEGILRCRLAKMNWNFRVNLNGKLKVDKTLDTFCKTHSSENIYQDKLRIPEWLFCSENCNPITVFSQKVVAWLQGPQKTVSDLVLTEKNRKAPKRGNMMLLGVFALSASFQPLDAFWWERSLMQFFFSLWALPFGSCLEHSFYNKIDTP